MNFLKYVNGILTDQYKTLTEGLMPSCLPKFMPMSMLLLLLRHTVCIAQMRPTAIGVTLSMVCAYVYVSGTMVNRELIEMLYQGTHVDLCGPREPCIRWEKSLSQTLPVKSMMTANTVLA